MQLTWPVDLTERLDLRLFFFSTKREAGVGEEEGKKEGGRRKGGRPFWIGEPGIPGVKEIDVCADFQPIFTQFTGKSVPSNNEHRHSDENVDIVMN